MHSISANADTAPLMLRERISRFLSNGTAWKAPLRQVISAIQSRHWQGVVFGGVIRDLAIIGPTERPRDIDIVVNGVSQREFQDAFGQWIVRRNRFGGLHLLVDKWMIDIWDIASTWGIVELDLKPSFEDLPKTTFLNVEAIAADLNVLRGHERTFYSHGFFEAVGNRILDINLERNPFPALCVVRSLLTAARLDFQISRRLATYIVCHSDGPEAVQEMVDAEVSHYGIVRVPGPRLNCWIESIQRQLEAGESTVKLPIQRAEQLTFAKFWCPAI